MTVFERIKEVIKKEKKTFKEVSQNTSMGEKGFHNALNKETLKVKVLIEIAKYLNVEPEVFFVEEGVYSEKEEIKTINERESFYQVKNDSIKEYEFLKEKVEHLEKLIEAKNEIIKLIKKDKKA